MANNKKCCAETRLHLVVITPRLGKLIEIKFAYFSEKNQFFRVVGLERGQLAVKEAASMERGRWARERQTMGQEWRIYSFFLILFKDIPPLIKNLD